MLIHTPGAVSYYLVRRRDVEWLGSLEAAVQFVSRFKGDAGAMSSLRRLVGHAGMTSDDDVLSEVARLIARGELMVASDWRRTPVMMPQGEPAAEDVPAPPLRAAPADEDDESADVGDLQSQAQAMVLMAAADRGVAFCEP